MRILHYFLGFPPYRTGGLTKFAFDLMKTQVNEENNVVALWPGEIRHYNGNPKIVKRNIVNGIVSYEIVNPLPVPLDEGINAFEAYTTKCDIKIYENFLRKVKPEVIHIHTLMGLHREFIQAANSLGIKIVFTTHDYFGLCPKVTLYRYGKCCDDDNFCVDCIQCNVHSLSLKQIQILQSPFYRWIKNTYFIRLLRKNHRSTFFSNEVLPEMPKVDIKTTAENYRKLRAYYVWMYEHIDFIHFNSSVSESIYKRYMKPINSNVISISHKDIKDNRDNRRTDSDKLRVIYLAPTKPFKGFGVLKQALDELWDEGKRNIELRVFGPVDQALPYMIVKENGFVQSDLRDIFSEADVLVAPSIWYETFGFTVLEALSYGIPVVVSDHVGAKDIISKQDKIVTAGNVTELKQAILEFSKKERLSVNQHIKVWEEFVNECYEMYK